MAGFSRGYVAQVLAAIAPVPPLIGPEGSRLTVNETVSTFSFFYERIRNLIDYKDEHLIRKSAILRIMKRQLVLESDPDVMADRLVRELIGARYLPNGILPESLVLEVALRLRKLVAVTRINAGSDRHREWLRGIVAVEIEEVLVDASNEKALVTFLYERLADSIRVRGASVDETERRLQVYLACTRSLVKADDEMLGFKLLRAYLPEWMRPDEWVDAPRPIAERLVAVELRIQGQLRHPLAQRYLRTVKPWGVSLSLLRDVLIENRKDAAGLLEKPESLAARISDKASEKYTAAKAKLRRGTARATLYLFVTKMILALILEMPLEYLWYNQVNWVSLAINLSFPPVLMFFVGLLIRVPGQANTDRLIAGVNELLSDAPMQPREITAPKIRRGFTGFLFGFAYLLTFVLTFGLIGLGLNALNFTWVSSAIFLFFLCVVSFFAFRLRIAAREVVVVESKQSLLAITMDFLSLPVLRAGQWLSRSISRLNVFLFFFDFLFEAPFKMFLSVLEEWFSFMKEKKDELQ